MKSYQEGICSVAWRRGQCIGLPQGMSRVSTYNKGLAVAFNCRTRVA